MATIQEVAREARVSTGTVSRYLNGYRLRRSNEERIQKAIDLLGYRPNLTARSLRRSKSKTVGMLMNNMQNNLAIQAVAQMERIMEMSDYTILLSGFREDRAVFERQLDNLVGRGIDGLVMFEAPWPDDAGADPVRDLDLPVIAVNVPYDAPNVDSIVALDRECTRKVVSHMIACGHERIGVIAAPLHEYVSRERLQGVLDAVQAAHMPPENAVVIFGDYTPRSGRTRMADLLDQGIDAIFVCNYKMAQGALQAVAERGLVIGRDLSYACYDYYDTHDLFYPRITTICPPAQEIGTLAATRLLEMIEGGERASGKTTMLPNSINWQPSIVKA